MPHNDQIHAVSEKRLGVNNSVIWKNFFITIYMNYCVHIGSQTNNVSTQQQQCKSSWYNVLMCLQERWHGDLKLS